MKEIISVLLCALQAWWAQSKGYNPAAWFLTAGPIGWIALGMQKNLRKLNVPEEEKLKIKKAGDLVGWVLTGISIALIIFLFILYFKY